MAQAQYGPDNPHPFSTIRTELIWEGKYDEYGNRREVDVAGSAFPLQKIETVDEPRSRAEVQGLLFEPQKSHRDDFRNRLIWGDNKLVMASLLKEFKGQFGDCIKIRRSGEKSTIPPYIFEGRLPHRFAPRNTLRAQCDGIFGDRRYQKTAEIAKIVEKTPINTRKM